jgi:Recombinase zinc beta ribbon domain
VQARVRAVEDVQVLNEGRHQGERALRVHGGPRRTASEPAQAAEGYRLRRLAVDEPAERMRVTPATPCSGNGRRWRGSPIRMMSQRDMWCVSSAQRGPDRALPQARTSGGCLGADFTRVQVELRSQSSQGMRGMATRPRSSAAKRSHLLRGLVQCAICRRKMQAGSIRRNVYYRCTARRLAPGSAALAEHPKTVNLREDVLTEAINGWIGGLFSPENRDDTVRALVESQGGAASTANEAGTSEGRRGGIAAVAGRDRRRDRSGGGQGADERGASSTRGGAHGAGGRSVVGRLDVAEVYAMIDATRWATSAKRSRTRGRTA